MQNAKACENVLNAYSLHTADKLWITTVVKVIQPKVPDTSLGPVGGGKGEKTHAEIAYAYHFVLSCCTGLSSATAAEVEVNHPRPVNKARRVPRRCATITSGRRFVRAVRLTGLL